MSKSTSDYVFKKLTTFKPFFEELSEENQHKGNEPASQDQTNFQESKNKKNGKKALFCFYELIAGMILMSYSEDHNKIRMLFLIFDFDNYQYLDKDEFTLMIIVTLEALGRFTCTKYNSRTELEKVSNIIFASRDARISIAEIAEWLDLNKPFTQLMKSLNPTVTVQEKSTTFLPLIKPKEHFNIMALKYLNKRLNMNMNTYDSLPQINTKKSHQLLQQGTSTLSSLGDKNYYLEKTQESLQSIFNQTLPSLISNNQLQVPRKMISHKILTQIPKLPSQLKFEKQQLITLNSNQTIRKSVYFQDGLKDSENQEEFFKLTTVNGGGSSTQRGGNNSNLEIDKVQRRASQVQNQPLTSRKREPIQNPIKKMRPGFKHIITIKGKTYSKQDILIFKAYFDKINVSHSGFITQEEYQRSVQNSDLMKRLSLSLFSFLDKDNDNKVTFEQLLYRILPGLTHEHYQIFQQWIEEETSKKARSVLNYKDQSTQALELQHQYRQKMGQELNFAQIKDFLYIFTQLDKDGDGLLSLDEVKNAFQGAFTPLQIEKYFQKYDDNQSQKLSIEEFLLMMTPSGSTMSKQLLENQVAQYVKEKTLKKNKIKLKSTL